MASENSALWGSLVKAMTRKIDVPGLSNQREPLRPEDLRPEPQEDGPAGRRASDRAISPPKNAPAESPDKAIERIAAHLSHLSRKIVADYLDTHGSSGGPLGQRLAALGLSHGDGTGGSFWWSVLSSGVVDAETFAEILRTCPGIPEHHARNGLLFDYVLDAEVGSYREVKAAAKTAAAEGRRLLTVLVDGGTLTDERAADVTAEFFGLRRRRGKKWSHEHAFWAKTNVPPIALSLKKK